jgi:FkbM family methyltransferase
MLKTVWNSAQKAPGRIRRLAYRLLRRDLLTGLPIARRADLTKLGTAYGGWVIPASFLNSRSICYCAGVGEDISFDLALIDHFHCKVFAFDPTPRAARHVAEHAGHNENYDFHPVGLWDADKTMRFFAPANPAHVSHSIVNLQKTDTYFDAPCKRLNTLMRELDHSRIDLLKLDIEGAEYKVLESLMTDAVQVGVLCVDYDEIHLPLDGQYRERIRDSARRLAGAGYALVAVDGGNYIFVHRKHFVGASGA